MVNDIKIYVKYATCLEELTPITLAFDGKRMTMKFTCRYRSDTMAGFKGCITQSILFLSVSSSPNFACVFDKGFVLDLFASKNKAFGPESEPISDASQ